MADEKDTGFKVSDRRKFNPDGTPKENVEVQIPKEEPPAQPPRQEASNPPPRPAAKPPADNVVSFPGESTKGKEASREGVASDKANDKREQHDEHSAVNAAAKQAYDSAETHEHAGFPQPSFLGLVNMLGLEAAVHLGMIESAPGTRNVDLGSAKQMIDLLGILRDKTRGNLTHEEEQMFENMLADLRMSFVEVSRRR